MCECDHLSGVGKVATQSLKQASKSEQDERINILLMFRQVFTDCVCRLFYCNTTKTKEKKKKRRKDSVSSQDKTKGAPTGNSNFITTIV